MAQFAGIQTFGAYRRAFIGPDLIAGLTVWAVLVPEVLAYATIAGVSPVVGLYAVAPSIVLYAIFGSSRHLIVGPMSATAALSAATVVPMAASTGLDPAALTAALAIVTGVVAIIAGLLRLGFVAGFISEPVLKGFIIGMALTIIVGQVPKLFGIDKGDGNFFQQAWTVIKNVGSTHLLTLAVGVLCLVAIAVMRTFLPRVPGSLVVVLLAIGAVAAFHLDQHGVEIVGTITPGLPHIAVPDVPFSAYVQMLGASGGIAVVGFAEGLGAAKEYAARAGYEVDPNRELLGLGAANLGSGMCGGMVVNGSLSKTAVNGAAGAKSQVSGLTAGVMTILTLLFLTPLFEKLPEATLAAVVILAVWELVDLRTLKSYYGLWSRRLGSIYGKTARFDFLGALAAMAGVLLLDTLPGLLIGILVSLLLLLMRVSRPYVARLGRLPGADGAWVEASNPQAAEVPGVPVLRVEAALFFANSDYVRRALVDAAQRGEKGLVVDASAVNQVDLTAARMLDDVARQLGDRHVRMVVAGVLEPVRDEVKLSENGHVPFARTTTIDEAVDLLTQPQERAVR